MHHLRSFSLFLLLAATLGCSSNEAEAPAKPADAARQFYQLKTYHFATDAQLARTEAYLGDAYLPALRERGFGPVGVFKPRPDRDTSLKLMVLLPFSDLETLATLEPELWQDSTFLAAGADYLQSAHDQPPYRRIESVIMRAFSEMPQMATPDLNAPRAERVYELRSYEGATEDLYWRKVDMFNAGGEVALFDSLDFNAVFYAEVVAGPSQPNLVYMTTFSDTSSRNEHWDAFGSSPTWTKLKAIPKYQNTVSHADIYLLYPTDYSDY